MIPITPSLEPILRSYSSQGMDKVTVRAPVNIAVIKYWGKRGQSHNTVFMKWFKIWQVFKMFFTETSHSSQSCDQSSFVPSIPTRARSWALVRSFLLESSPPDEALNLPLHSSVSMTLDMNTMYTETTVERCEGQSSIELNGTVGQPNNRSHWHLDILLKRWWNLSMSLLYLIYNHCRVQRVLTKVEQECGEEVSAKVVTLNTFPTAAGTCAMQILTFTIQCILTKDVELYSNQRWFLYQAVA